MNIDFDPEKAFQEIDLDRDGFVTSYELFRFMKEVLSVRLSLSEAEALIKEFDGNTD
jgi:Ca2+-binding EF-hand superfamily protein